jgi:hypothetical protein
MQRADDCIQRPRLMFGVELFFEPLAWGDSRGRKFKKVSHSFVDYFGSAAGIRAPIRHATPLKQPLGGRIRLYERQDGSPDL